MAFIESTTHECNELDALAAFIDRRDAAGTPCTTAEREAAVLGVLANDPQWSDRRIAMVAGVTPKTVARLRNVACASLDRPISAAGDIAVKRVGRDGRSRPAQTGTMRAAIVAELEAQPDASLRTIARRLQVSPETVRTVRRDWLRPSPAPQPERPGPVARHDDATPPRAPVRHLHVARSAWREDAALRSTVAGPSFIDWLESTDVTAMPNDWIDEIPISRVYEIVDEAQRRAAVWTDFARRLEARTRRR